MNTLRTFFSIFLTIMICSTSVHAGEEYSEQGIKNEISYLAKKLLDMSGQDSYTVEYKSYAKPYIGVCTEINQQGIAITCVTPGSQADKAGLKTGDVVIELDGVSVQGKDVAKIKGVYMGVVESMKEGDVILMKLNRGSKTNAIKVTVGSLSHPAYTLNIKR